ncbi:transmembrane protein adipocyte-associated 1 homolog [Ixodes scapularis]|uniref:transmembrane protein adipocyte-associated 1 homolog n=1 Tax=Ixodes scapularis TaxID=6945 RepID=UPI001A9CBCD2|nr:transmembrane protein adipocyte-associated 1 homolog [Ixodes scapularis]XP_040076728.1 transmembrane protein adipocyte-associated 1 homolog [Ixodes scapularis]
MAVMTGVVQEFLPSALDGVGNESSPTPSIIVPEYFCKWILYHEIPGSRVRVWDLSILVPNVFFLLFMVLRFNRARLKLRATSSPTFSTFYVLVSVNAVISVIRCVVSMTVNAAAPVGGVADKVLWVAVRFFLLSTEMSVLIFGLAFGHLDSRTSIQRVLTMTSLVAFLYSGTQGVLEFVMPDRKFFVPDKNFELFGHGGMLFWFVSSVVFAAVYLAVFSLPWTRLRDRLALPSKRSFYWYALFLALLNLAQASGSGLYYYDVNEGVCVVDVTSYIYFTIFTPLVYKTFLADFFSISQPSILFSYKAQTDEPIEDDNVSLPHQLSCSSLKTDSDYIYQNNSVYDSTHFDSANVNPLYAQSLQSPDSVVGFDYCGASQRPGYQTTLAAPSQQQQQHHPQSPPSGNNVP